MKEIWSKKDFLKNELVKDLHQRIDEINKDIKKLMDLLRKSKNEKMIENYENEIIGLEEEKTTVQLKIDSKEVQEPVNIEEIISNTKAILRNPSFIRDL
jgi:predicted  nucleic acid-binding Zn-ribbon protein